MTKSFLIASMTLLLFSCRDIQRPSDEKVFVPEWDLFRIKVDDREFWIPFNEDSSLFLIQMPDSFTKQFRPNRKSFLTEKVFIPQAEKDTIRKLAIEAITKPVLTTQEVTDYAGQYVTLSLQYAKATKLECKYSSVYSWTSISPTLKKISEKTFEKYGQ